MQIKVLVFFPPPCHASPPHPSLGTIALGYRELWLSFRLGVDRSDEGWGKRTLWSRGPWMSSAKARGPWGGTCMVLSLRVAAWVEQDAVGPVAQTWAWQEGCEGSGGLAGLWVLIPWEWVVKLIPWWSSECLSCSAWRDEGHACPWSMDLRSWELCEE